MTTEDELKLRARAESQALAELLQLTISRCVVLSGENAVARAKLVAQDKTAARPAEGIEKQ